VCFGINLRKINYPSIILEQNKLITYKWLKLKEYQLFQTIVKKNDMMCKLSNAECKFWQFFGCCNKNKFKYELHKF